MTPRQPDRPPYVGEGADGARRSAEIVAEEIDLLACNDPRREWLAESRQRWLDQAARLEEVNGLPTGQTRARLRKLAAKRSRERFGPMVDGLMFLCASCGTKYEGTIDAKCPRCGT